MMEKTMQIRASAWEKRLPDLDDEWTHWWLEGEGFCIGVVSTIHDAIEIIKTHWLRYPSIYAYRAAIGSDGRLFRQEKRRAEVANAFIDK